ncbi:hypothetical protein HZA99_03025 [Candidatus Woesearchaeota archaeon]|nr:hypothetical protein [Candidatus Woesearchaeota archaeon]
MVGALRVIPGTLLRRLRETEAQLSSLVQDTDLWQGVRLDTPHYTAQILFADDNGFRILLYGLTPKHQLSGLPPPEFHIRPFATKILQGSCVRFYPVSPEHSRMCRRDKFNRQELRRGTSYELLPPALEERVQPLEYVLGIAVIGPGVRQNPQITEDFSISRNAAFLCEIIQAYKNYS